jgi:hypothetical protein
VSFVRGKVYRRPATDDAWCLAALAEIAREHPRPIRIALQMNDGTSLVGHLENVDGGIVTLDIPREKQAVTLPGDRIIAFSLVGEQRADSD